MAEIQYELKRIMAYDIQAENRFSERRINREETQTKLKEIGTIKTDSPQRVQARKSLINKLDGVALERIIGCSDLLDINYLNLGIRASQSICRVQVRSEIGAVLGFGTGFLVSPMLVMTNNHVINKLELAKRSLVDFGYEDDDNFVPKTPKTFTLEPGKFFYTNPNLDFTIVAVSAKAIDGSPLANFGFLPLIAESGKILLDECLTIIGHNSGATKQITLRDNKVVDIFDNYVHYLTDTEPGASGSPAFNDQWDVAALHHAGVRKKDSEGRVLSKDGSVWEPNMGEEEIAWEANEGIRISSIVQDLQNNSKNFPEEQQKTLNTIFEKNQSPYQQIVPPQTTNVLPAMETKEQSLEWYTTSEGYNPDFSGKNIPLPKIPDELRKDVVPLKEGQGYELKYTHFSIVMSKSRKLALFTAVNVNGSQMVEIKRGVDHWYFDPRIDIQYQSGPELYEANDLDMGHLVKRTDPAWGTESDKANEDTFHFTNCSPQHKKLNRDTWEGLEDYIGKNAKSYSLKVTVFTGAIFRDDDMLYRGKFQIPAEFWKVVVIPKEDGNLSATAYLETQKNLIQDLEFAYGEYKTYQIPITKIEALTRLDFGELRNFDPIANIEGTIGRLITKPEDAKLY